MSVVVAHSSDWVAVYVDGRKIEDGHSIGTENLLEALGYKVRSIEVEEDEFGGADFPENLANIKEAPSA